MNRRSNPAQSTRNEGYTVFPRSGTGSSSWGKFIAAKERNRDRTQQQKRRSWELWEPTKSPSQARVARLGSRSRFKTKLLNNFRPTMLFRRWRRNLVHTRRFEVSPIIRFLNHKPRWSLYSIDHETRSPCFRLFAFPSCTRSRPIV